MGNSEVGHLTIGSGRVLFQDLMRVNKSIEDGSFFENPALVGAFERGEQVHLLGLVSYGGVHSHIDHVRALLRFAPEKTWIHAFTDGRDVSPQAAVHDLAELPQDRIATVAGRYYAMDRDQRWERTQRAFDAIVAGKGEQAADPIEAVRQSYERGITDEFIEPVALAAVRGSSRDGHSDLLQLPPRPSTPIDYAACRGRCRYHHDDAVPGGSRCAGRLPRAGGRARRWPRSWPSTGCASCTPARPEKYAHVTYFFNGGREEEWAGETRILVPSPRDVPSYDRKPEMSARELTDRFVEELERDGYGFAVVNLQIRTWSATQDRSPPR